MRKIVGVLLSVFGIILIFALALGANEISKTKWENFDNQELKVNIEKAFEQISFTTSNIEQIEKFKNWMNGTIYKITYNGTIYRVYAYDDGQVVSINENSTNEAIYENDNIKLANNESDSTVLKYGELGEYGKNVTYDGKTYIKYFLPKGEYEVKALTPNAMFFIEDTKIYKNSFGYDESKTIDTITLSNVDSARTITLQDNHCINLVINTVISIKKLK